ncbi:tannase/feruloyl esterase family alpha/beta hydrolase [Paraburkholderia sp. CNPSo 3076]|uniref:tannase/feruloyl esterase family alpha/beta hydrolase n=1 Tax=Paraburkholderia sp. CNPSo 3076 TaxID=2940936 RepID=UPI003A521142
MRTLHIRRLFTSVRARAASLLSLCALFAAATLVAACGSGGSGSSSADASKAPLAVVAPVVDCSKLTSVDITDIGGAGSAITSASMTTATINGASVNFCTVKGTLAPSNTFEVALPVSTWTQRFAALGCGGLCGNLSDPTQQSSFSFSYRCPLVQEGGFVTAATDMGHSGNDTTWTTDPQKTGRFRLSRAAHHDAHGGKAHQGLLRANAEVRVLHRLLGRRPRSADGRATLPERL